MAPWRKQWGVLDPGKILLDLAISVAMGGDCLADISVVRTEPAVFGRVASDPTVSQLVDALAASPQAAVAAINQARVAVRGRVWKLAGKDAPDFGIDTNRPLIIDLGLATTSPPRGADLPTRSRAFELMGPASLPAMARRTEERRNNASPRQLRRGTFGTSRPPARSAGCR